MKLENEVKAINSQIKTLLGADKGFYSKPFETIKKERKLKGAAARDISNYVFSCFCRAKKDNLFFNTSEIKKELSYSENTIISALEDLHFNEIFLIKKVFEKTYVIFIFKEMNKLPFSKISGENISAKILNFRNKNTEFHSQSTEFHSQSTEFHSQSTENSETLKPLKNKVSCPSDKMLLDLNIIDLNIIDHHQIDQKNDDDFLKEKKRKGKENFIWDDSCEKLLLQFKDLKNKDGKNVSFNLEVAEKFIRNKDHDFLKNELKAFPFRVDESGKAVGAGYLVKLILAGKSNAPGEFIKNENLIKTKSLENEYGKILSIWDLGSSSANIKVVKHQISSKIKDMIYSKNHDNIKANLILMKSLCDIREFISESALNELKMVKLHG